MSTARIFADRWQHDESPFLNPGWADEWREIASEINDGDGAGFVCRAMMSCHELAAFDALPEIVTVWRGINLPASEDPEEAIRQGMSWTLDRDRAVWFARRFQGVVKHDGRRHDRAYVATGTIHKTAIYALFHSRQESEVVLDGECLEIEQIEPL